MRVAPANAYLEVSRPTGWRYTDRYRSYHVLVDGQDIGEIRRGQCRVFPIAPGRHELHVVIDWARSPSATVDPGPGETLRFECWPRYRFWQAKRALSDTAHWIVLSPAPIDAEPGRFC